MESPVCSLVVPAHNEATVIDRLLRGLAPLDDLEVVVVANGCTDDTAARARRHPGVRVLELADGGKPGALRAGDDAATAFPRFFVDADVQLDHASLLACAQAMTAAGAPAAAPRIVFDDSRSSRVVRAFYRHVRTTPYVTDGLIGLGVYALSEQGRSRFDAFPDLVADDLFVSGLFTPSERLVVDEASFTVQVPRTVRSLVDVRTRVYYGNAEAARAGSSGTLSAQAAGDSARDALRTRDRGAVLAYYGVNAWAKLRARSALRRGSFFWLRDASSR